MKKRLLDEAKLDLADIRRYTLQQWGPQQSLKYLRSIRAAINTIADNPQIGVRRDDIRKGVMLFPHGQHTIYFTLHHNAVVIIRVLNRLVLPEPRVTEVQLPE